MKREQLLEQLETQTYDLLVIGGGATGAGIALDAATRGLKVALVERGDFSEGTSSRSTKLVHGGVRYLEAAVKHLDKVQYNLVRDALHERGVILRLAPHLAHPIPLLTPLYKAWEVPYYFSGLKAYDLLAGHERLKPSRFVPRSRALEEFPQLKEEGLVGGVEYYDGQFDDARMNVAVILTALREGAVALNYVEVTGLVKEGGRVRGAVVHDRLGGASFEVRAGTVVNATGPFTDTIRRMDDPDATPMVVTSSGVHIILPGRFSPPGTGLLIPKTEDGRVLFVLPWMGHTLAGTTDEPAELSFHPKPKDEEIDYILRHLKRYFALEPSRDDILAAWSGLRPLVKDPKAHDTAELARDHLISESDSGLVTIAGGKWTTYRKMAEDLVDYVVRTRNLHPPHGCITDRVFIEGAAAYDPEGWQGLMTDFGLDEDVARHLNQSYGDRASEVAWLAAEGLDARLAPDHPFVEAEVVWATRNEMAATPIDVLARRARLAFLDQNAALAALKRTAELMAGELGWSVEEEQAHIDEGRERILEAL
ncbi:FAD-dependent oxidoreductase [Oceanithermus sp.]